MLQRDADSPLPSACCSSMGGWPSLGRAAPGPAACPPCISSFTPPMVTLPPPPHPRPGSCSRSSILTDNRKNHEEATGRLSRAVEETPET